MPSSTDNLEFYDLSHPWGDKAPLWPYFPDVKIERFHYHAKSRVLSQQITTFMHCTTHTDAPAHVIEGMPFMDEVPLDRFFGTGVVVSIPKGKWEKITPEDLEKAEPKIEPGDIVIINSGWHKYYGDNVEYFCYSPGLYLEAGEWLVERGVKAVGVDQQQIAVPEFGIVFRIVQDTGVFAPTDDGRIGGLAASLAELVQKLGLELIFHHARLTDLHGALVGTRGNVGCLAHHLDLGAALIQAHVVHKVFKRNKLIRRLLAGA